MECKTVTFKSKEEIFEVWDDFVEVRFSTPSQKVILSPFFHWPAGTPIAQIDTWLSEELDKLEQKYERTQEHEK